MVYGKDLEECQAHTEHTVSVITAVYCLGSFFILYSTVLLRVTHPLALTPSFPSS